MNVILVYNAKSGSSLPKKELQKKFRQASIEVTAWIQIGPRLESLLAPYIRKKEIVAVLGGDGSISAVAHLLKHTDAVLMPLPGGTLNHFTKDLGIPQSLPEALEYFKTAQKVRIDTGLVGDRTFINNSSIGIYSDSLLERDEHEKTFGKWPAMALSGFISLYRFRTYRVELNGKMYRTPLIFIGNNEYEITGLTFRRSHLHGGVLSVYIVVGGSRVNLFWALTSLLLGKKKNTQKKLTLLRAKNVIISTKKPVRVSRDGEHEKMTSPLKYSIEEASLLILKRTRD